MQAGVAHSIEGKGIGGMLKLSRVKGPDEDRPEINGLCGFPQIGLHTWVMLKHQQGCPIDQRLILQGKYLRQRLNGGTQELRNIENYKGVYRELNRFLSCPELRY